MENRKISVKLQLGKTIAVTVTVETKSQPKKEANRPTKAAGNKTH